jgi:predicted dehydrogenase
MNKLNVIILGAGRMGVRHAQGICKMEEVNSLLLVDIVESGLTSASDALKDEPGYHKIRFEIFEAFIASSEKFDVAILAATSRNRLDNCRMLVEKGAKHVLIEKPLGQSMEEVRDQAEYFESLQGVEAYVNLNMRLYESFQQLRTDINTLPQFNGEKTISVNTGAIGIGANGIHYLDMFYQLFEADDARIVAGAIDQKLIPSARGPEFNDFGGWCVIEMTRSGTYLGKVMLSISANSTAFGGWDIIGHHARISIDQIQQKRVDTLRREDSTMPIYRYAADYFEPVVTPFESPFLGDLTRLWLESVLKGERVLPGLRDSEKVHQLMFDWLALSKTHKGTFPIT